MLKSCAKEEIRQSAQQTIEQKLTELTDPAGELGKSVKRRRKKNIPQY